MRAMSISLFRSKSVLATFGILFTFAGTLTMSSPLQAQEAIQAVMSSPRPLITEMVDETQRTVLRSNTHPLARPEFDLGTAPASLPMERMLLVLKRSADQEYGLRKMLDNQQDKKSPSYHKWLTPTQFGQQFGPTDSDMQTIVAWLQSHGFQVGTTKGRTVLEFSGSASQVQEAFHTTIHKYIVNGEQHWANANDPSIPTALTPAVAGVLTLHNFIKKPAIHLNAKPVLANLTPGKRPLVTFPSQNGQPAINALAPQDYAVIYNLNPVYALGEVGSSSTIAVVSRSNLFNGGADVSDFRNVIGLGNSTFGGFVNIVLNGPDPGDLGGGEEAEATLDSTWSGALAPGASINLVVSATTDTTDGIDLSEAYIIESNFANVMTESFSACELYATDAQLLGASALAEQAAAQGITYFVSSGDDGAEGCDDPSVAPATNPISVNFLASTAFDIAVGGTMFNENGTVSKYWTSTAPISETALSYIPEDVWNESSLTNGLWSGSGGASAGNIASGSGSTGGIPKPSWQAGVSGIPSDGVRDLPDVSLTAAQHDPYLLCLEGSCVPNAQGQLFVYFVSGTSASAPSFAGIMALVDDNAARSNSVALRQGQANYVLYRLAAGQTAYPAQCNGSGTTTPPGATCIFNDVTSGTNVVPGETGTQYQAGAGFDLTTGLGSVNVNNLVTNWSTVNFNPTTTTLTTTATTITHGSPVPFTIGVASNSNSGTPTGDVSLTASGSNASLGLGFWTLAQGSVSSNTSDIPGGSYTLTAYYAGDGTFAPSYSAASSAFTVSPEPSTTTVSVLTAAPTGASIPFTNGPFGSFVYLRADVAGQSGVGSPTGTVTFNDTFGSIPGGNTFTLNAEGNTATPNGVLTFDAGTHTISASYSGDNSFNSSSTTQSQTFTITPGFFASISASQSTVVVTAPGTSGTSSVTVSNSTGFKGTITLACTGLPPDATCTFSPASISTGGTIGTNTSTITVATTAATAMNHRQRRTFFPALWVIGFGLVFSTLGLSGKQQRFRALFVLILVAALIVVPACGGGGGGSSNKTTSNPGTPTGTYSVAVTATNGTSVSTTAFTLIVQ